MVSWYRLFHAAANQCAGSEFDHVQDASWYLKDETELVQPYYDSLAHPYVFANHRQPSSFSYAPIDTDRLHCLQADKSESNAVSSYQSNPDDPFLSGLHAITRSEEHKTDLMSRDIVVWWL